MTPEDVLHSWIDSVNSLDLDRVLSHYADGATLVPTFSAKTLRTPDEIRDYFVRLAERPELSVSLHRKTLTIQEQTTTAVLSGVYCFHFHIDDEPYHFEARFSYVIDKTTDSRPILHHHSSQIPRQLG